MSTRTENILFISDTHFPYAHRDTFAFLTTVRDKYNCTIFKHVGDEVDNHTGSFHEIEYNTLSARDEYLEARDMMQEMAELFPKLTIAIGNHSAMSYRKAKMAGIPEDHIKSYKDMWGVDCKWTDADYFTIPNKQHCLMTHTMGGNTLTNAKVHSHCSVQGHHHSLAGVEYFADKEVLRWSMTVGCLIDTNHPAFNYAKGATQKRPIISCGVLVNGQPIVVPMVMNRKGRWTGCV